MNTKQIISRCTDKLEMTQEQAKWVADNLYNYAVPDWSEMSWRQIDQCLRDTLLFKPVETQADKLRVGDTVKIGNGWRVIVEIGRGMLRIRVLDDLGQTHYFRDEEWVQTQLLQLL